MNLIVKQLSSLEKVLDINKIEYKEIDKLNALLGEQISYQISACSNESTELEFEIVSELKPYIQAYVVKNIIMDFPVYPENANTGYLTKEPGYMPDLLIPLEDQHGTVRSIAGACTIWLTINVPKNIKGGAYDIEVSIKDKNTPPTLLATKHMSLNIIEKELPEQSTIFTQWLHVDCIASAHNTEIYSARHWELIEAYMKTASELGINMILTPVITPPLDTAIGTSRPCTQLVKIEKNGSEYHFDFTLLKRWIELCKKYNMKYYEISHLFSQWGLETAPNIWVTENGENKHMFGWHVKSDDPAYIDFLGQFLPALLKFFEEEGIKDCCRFHLSDEPGIQHVETYKKLHDIVKPMLGDCPIIDAISDIDFYEHRLIDIPVCATTHITPFIERNAENYWAYYCCGQSELVSNRFMAMPSCRNRVIGLQLYKYDIPGFLQWGYNFYNSQFSRYPINPYITTSTDGAFPSGDPFSVYPGKDGPLLSLRALVFKEALQDIELCRLLEKSIGKEAVMQIIEEKAGGEITFFDYPNTAEFMFEVIDELKSKL